MGAAPATDRVAVTEELARVAKQLGDQELVAWTQKFRIEDALELGESDLVDRSCDMQEVIADDLRQPLFRCHSLHHRAMRAHRGGAFAKAEASAEQGLQLGLRSGHQVALQFYGVQLWSLRRDQGRLEELEPQVLELIRSFPEDSGWRAALAIDYMERGDLQGAAKNLTQLVDRERESIRSSVNWTTTPALLAQVASRLGDEPRARLLYDELLPHRAGHVIVSHSMVDFGPVDRYLGLCAATFDRERGIRHLRAALESCEASRMTAITAATRVDLATALWERERDAAASLAGQARSEAVALGLPHVERAASRLLESS
jgi:tetratricopeptide (TPR) repeat protein